MAKSVWLYCSFVIIIFYIVCTSGRSGIHEEVFFEKKYSCRLILSLEGDYKKYKDHKL